MDTSGADGSGGGQRLVGQFRQSARLMAELTKHSPLLSDSQAHAVMRAQLALVAAGAVPVEPSSVAREEAVEEAALTLSAEDFMALVDPQAAWVQPVRASLCIEFQLGDLWAL